MVRPRLPIVVILAVASMGAGLSGSVTRDPAAEGAETRPVDLLELAAVRRLVAPLARLGAALSNEQKAAALADLTQVCEAVLGAPLEREVGFDELIAAAATRLGPRMAAAAGVAARDATAYSLLGVGYSARETADVVGGRISVAALDTARRIRAAGLGRERAADYLDREYRRAASLRQPLRSPSRVTATPSSAFDPVIDRYSHEYGVEAEVVRAIIKAESGYSPAAVSRAGAIGLMQLMPTTARELGVDPHVPEQNIEGGIRYFAGLLRMFGRLELALVAYNGGPGYAQRYARGDALLYGETRAYVRNVMQSLGARGR